MRSIALACLSAALLASTAALASPKPAMPHSTASGAGVMVIAHKVADFAKWWPIYEADKATRDAAGLTACKAHQSVDDANMVVILCNMSDPAKAKAFAAAPGLKDKMTAAGVVGAPTIYFLNGGK